VARTYLNYANRREDPGKLAIMWDSLDIPDSAYFMNYYCYYHFGYSSSHGPWLGVRHSGHNFLFMDGHAGYVAGVPPQNLWLGGADADGQAFQQWFWQQGVYSNPEGHREDMNAWGAGKGKCGEPIWRDPW
jgi:prepilin-type processing-associated H-X9-DG protein